MAETSNKDADTSKQEDSKYKLFMGARVLWPPDVADDILESAIMETHAALKTYSVVEQGQKIVEHLKKFMDRTWEAHWHVFFGTNFGSHVVHEKRSFLFFNIDKHAFLMYKMG